MDAEQIIKAAGDVAAGTIAFGAVMSWLPAVAALFSIVWFGIQIWESKTGQSWRRKLGELLREIFKD